MLFVSGARRMSRIAGPAAEERDSYSVWRWLRRLLLRLAASDPALVRLRMGSRATLTIVLTGLALFLAQLVHPLPLSAYGIAVTTAFVGSLAIREPTPFGRAITRLYSGIAGLAVVALASAVREWPAVADGLFIVVIFVAVYVRKFGIRWSAVGQFAFMCYFLGCYLRPAAADLPGVAIAIVISGIVAHLVRNFLLRDDRASDFRGTVVVVDRRIGELASQIRTAARRGAWSKERVDGAFDTEKAISDSVLVAEGLLPFAGKAPEGSLAADLPVLLFDVQLAAERALVIALELVPREQAAEPEVPIAAKDDGSASARRENETRLRSALINLRAAREKMLEAARSIPDSAFQGGGDSAKNGPGAAATGGGKWLSDPALRVAIQVAIASAIAMGLGLTISKTRWFWAVLTAFLVFTNTQSRGDTAIRAFQRAGGTLVGIVVGIGLATIMQGHVAWSLVLITILIFIAFYVLQLSYAAMTFFITLAVSLLYGLIGMFTPQLLVLRLEETLIGAVAGIFIAFFVFPQRTISTVADAVDAFFRALDDLLAAVQPSEAGARPDLLALSRTLDRRYQDLATAARPLGSNWQLVLKPGHVRQTLIRFMGCAYWARSFARALTSRDLGADDRAALAERVTGLRRQIAEARAAKASFFGGRASPHARTDRPAVGRAEISARTDDPLFALDVIAHIIDRTAQHDQPDAAPKSR